MKKIIITLVLAAFLIGGCTATQQQYIVDTSALAAESSQLRDQYDGVEDVLRLMQAEHNVFSEEEYQKLMDVDVTIDMLIKRFDMMSRFDETSLNVQDVKFLWEMSGTAYVDAREIMYNHWDEFDSSVQILLSGFDGRAVIVSERLDELLTNPDNEDINDAMVLIANILTIATKMMSTSVVL